MASLKLFRILLVHNFGEHSTYTFLPKHSRFIDVSSSHVVPCNLAESALLAKNLRNNPPCLSYGHGTSDNRRRGIVSDFRITVSRHLGISRSRIAHDLTRRRQDRSVTWGTTLRMTGSSRIKVMAPDCECIRSHMYDQFDDTQSATPGIYQPIATLYLMLCTEWPNRRGRSLKRKKAVVSITADTRAFTKAVNYVQF